MKKKWIGAIGLPMAACFLLCGCPAKNNPSAPGNPPAPTGTPTATPTLTSTPTNLGGLTSTFTPSFTPSSTPTITPTFTPSATLTRTPTPTPSFTPTSTLSQTASPTPTLTFTPTVTSTQCVNGQGTPCTSTPTPTSTSGVDWNNAVIYHSVSGGFTNASVDLAVNGQPVSTAGVTLSGTFSGSPVALLFNSTIPIGPVTYALYQAAGFNWEPGQTYILTTDTTAGTASATLTAPGNIVFAPLDSHGGVTQVSWGVEGNTDSAYVRETAPADRLTFDTYVSADVDSPVYIPDSAYPGGSGCFYYVDVEASNRLSIIPGATASSSLQVNEIYSATVTWN